MQIIRLMFFVVVLAAVPGLSRADFVIPCERVDTHQSITIRTAQELASRAGIKRRMTGCRVSRGNWPTLIFATLPKADGTLDFLFSQELEDTVSPQAIRGMVAHEIGHLLAEDHENPFWRELTDDQKLDQEASADAAAVRLVGPEAITHGLDEYERLFEVMALRSTAQIKQEIAVRRGRLHGTS